MEAVLTRTVVEGWNNRVPKGAFMKLITKSLGPGERLIVPISWKFLNFYEGRFIGSEELNTYESHRYPYFIHIECENGPCDSLESMVYFVKRHIMPSIENNLVWTIYYYNYYSICVLVSKEELK